MRTGFTRITWKDIPCHISLIVLRHRKLKLNLFYSFINTFFYFIFWHHRDRIPLSIHCNSIKIRQITLRRSMYSFWNFRFMLIFHLQHVPSCPFYIVLILNKFMHSIIQTFPLHFQFEWAWQHPHSSRRLSHVSRRSRKESSLQFHWRVVSNMLQVAPWNRLPLTARWLKQEYRMDFEPSLQPPLHVPITFGPVRAKKMLLQSTEQEEHTSKCFLCKGLIKVNNFFWINVSFFHFFLFLYYLHVLFCIWLMVCV